ncbi:hypothetical protein [Acidipila rosea]|uniref:DUF5666 domain-containing protein n=1 Tax=Acidipila rosea TaxID=768535 RepID=A0A4R1L3Z2_9BACT|nr:hypothetical protein [Acidipila rosea]MBW4026302.1 hypothetical protein [Acidobacteriota bacterium]MBW4044562.1 hypothetical protein [Acidobacteriota bacterium]TCK72734.1 hypothetical protein C7378_2324 [Acidipila rosea]
MVRLFPVVMLSIVAVTPSSLQAQTPEQAPLPSASAPAALPPLPPGKSTVIGGEIRNVDPVRDQFTLQVFGGGSIKVLYDERTQIYRNGTRIPVRNLHADNHASVETTLDGTKVFALRIHMLSHLPQGECQGQVLSYNPQTTELTVRAAQSQEPITLRVPAGTPVVRIGQNGFAAQQGGVSDLAHGSLVDVTFESGSKGKGIATHVNILAVPGATFIFSGNISFLDTHTGRLVLVDPTDSQSYQVSFDPSRFPVSSKLHQGSHVKVTTSFDGSRYVASDITLE